MSFPPVKTDLYRFPGCALPPTLIPDPKAALELYLDGPATFSTPSIWKQFREMEATEPRACGHPARGVPKSPVTPPGTTVDEPEVIRNPTWAHAILDRVVRVKFCKIGRSCVLVMRLDGVRVSCALAGRPC